MILKVPLASTSFFNDANLVAYWKLEDVNDSKGSYTLTNNGSTPFSAAMFNNGAVGNGSDRYFNRAPILSNGNCTICGWIKANAEISAGIFSVISNRDVTTHVSYQITYDYNAGTRRLAFRRVALGGGGTSGLVSYNITLGTADFYHVALTYDGTNVIGYVNGSNIGSAAASGNGASGTDNFLQIFSVGGDIGNFTADDFAIFTRALSDTEVSDLYTPNFVSFSPSNISQSINRSNIY